MKPHLFLLLIGLLCASNLTAAPAPATSPAPDNPQRWEEHIKKFEAADRQKMPQPGGVVFVGSSSIVGWKTSQAFGDANAINRGFGGSRSSDAAHYAERIVTPYQPRLVVFYSGENDIAGGKTPQDVIASFTRFAEKVRAAQAELRIVFISLKPSPSRWRLNEQFQQANRLVREYIESQQNMTFIDVQADMIGPDGQPRKELFRDDMLHMNERGYAIWNEKVRPMVVESR